MAETKYLDGDKLKIWRVEDGSLAMRHGEQRRFIGPPQRALPLSDPDHWIVFSDCDGNELGVLKSIEELDEPSQNVLRETLRREYSLERITRILEVDKEPLTGQTHWRVEIASETEAYSEPTEDSATEAVDSSGQDENDEGIEKPRRLAKVASFLSLSREKNSEDAISVIEREFTINSQDDVATARYPHIYIVDIERKRYEIVNCETLDLESRKAADRFF